MSVEYHVVKPLLKRYRVSYLCGKVALNFSQYNCVRGCDKLLGKIERVARKTSPSFNRVEPFNRLACSTVKVDAGGENSYNNYTEITAENDVEYPGREKVRINIQADTSVRRRQLTVEPFDQQFTVKLEPADYTVDMMCKTVKTEHVNNDGASNERIVVKVIRKAKKRKFSVQFKDQVVNYSHTYSVEETCSHFGVTRRNLARWRRESVANTSSSSRNLIFSRTQEFKLEVLKCLNINSNTSMTRLFKIPLSKHLGNKKIIPTSDPFVIITLPHEQAGLKRIWDLVIAPPCVADEALYSLLSCDRFFCYNCHIKFASMKDKEMHALLEHSFEKPFLCMECWVRFKMMEDVLQHMKSPGGGGFQIKCEDCDLICKTISQYYHHYKIHTGLKEFGCRVCGLSFTSLNLLICHEDVHKAFNFKCIQCDKGFHREENKKSHIKKHHAQTDLHLVTRKACNQNNPKAKVETISLQ